MAIHLNLLLAVSPGYALDSLTHPIKAFGHVYGLFESIQ